MRAAAAVVAGLVAMLALLVTAPLLWISTHVADREGYVGLSSTLADDPELQAAFAAYLSDELIARGALPDALRPTATQALTQVAGRATDEPGFVEAWEETQRGFHRSVFADPTPQVLALDVGPMAEFVATRVADRLPVSLTVPDDLVVPIVTDADDRAAVDQVRKTRWMGYVGALVALVAAAATVGLARRSSVAVAWLGAGAAAVAGVLWLLSGPVSQQVLDHTAAPSEFARTLQKLLVDRAASSLDGWLLWIAVAGAAAAAAGLVARVAAGRD
ncbi:MAG: hypothetical protein JWP31_2496 [Aeromicrobium sp.]|nr:hypothetical protein [Aeromicrobium sp.]